MLHPTVGNPVCVAWNNRQILEALHKHTCVKAFICGHDHSGGNIKDDHGIQHITVHGMIESTPGDPDYAIVKVYEDRIELEGYGRVPSLQF